MRKLLCLFSVFSLFSLPILNVSAESSESTKEEIDQRFEHISQKYNIGDELSKEDAKFVKKYAKPVEKSVESQKSQSFNKTGYTPGKKIGGNIKGNVTSNLGVLKNSWGTNFLAKKVKGKTTKITASATHTAYGLIGSGGVGLVHKKTFKKTCKKTQCRLQESEKYTASVAYSYTTAKGKFHYSSGSFSVVAP